MAAGLATAFTSSLPTGVSMMSRGSHTTPTLTRPPHLMIFFWGCRISLSQGRQRLLSAAGEHQPAAADTDDLTELTHPQVMWCDAWAPLSEALFTWRPPRWKAEDRTSADMASVIRSRQFSLGNLLNWDCVSVLNRISSILWSERHL